MRWTIGRRLAFGMGAIIALFLMSDLIVYWRAREFNALGSGFRLFALLAGVAVGFLTLRGVTRPVRSLLAATQALAAGDLSRRALQESMTSSGGWRSRLIKWPRFSSATPSPGRISIM